MKNPADERECEALIQGYLEGSLTDDESIRLRSLLQQDPAIADLILAGLRDDFLIRSVVAEWMVGSPAESSVRVFGRLDLLQWMMAMLDSARRNARYATAVGAGAFAVLLVLFWVCCFGPTVGTPVVTEVQGTGIVLERSHQPLAPTRGMSLRDGDILRTPEGATAVIGFGPENTRITLLPGTEFMLATFSRSKRFDLRLGKLEASVARQRPFRPMILKTPQAEARVIGTRFALTVTTNSTRLDVTEGKVRFTRTSDLSAVEVATGHFAVAAADYELAALPFTGRILFECWTNIPGKYYTVYLTANTNYPNRPSGREYLSKFETPSIQVSDYAARIRGYLLPPVTGDYTFWITAEDRADLLLGSDDNPEHRQEIAHTEGPSRPTQQSTHFALKAGRRYYIEVLDKTGDANGRIAVYWEGPGRNREIIPGEFLSPWELK